MFESGHDVMKIAGAIRRARIKTEQLALSEAQRHSLAQSLQEAEVNCMRAFTYAVQTKNGMIDFGNVHEANS